MNAGIHLSRLLSKSPISTRKLADCRLKSPSRGFNINAKRKEFEKTTFVPSSNYSSLISQAQLLDKHETLFGFAVQTLLVQ